MKTFTTLFLAVLILTFIFYGFRNDDPKVKNRPQSNPEHIIKFLEDLPRPYGTVLSRNSHKTEEQENSLDQRSEMRKVSNIPPETLRKMWYDSRKLPDEKDLNPNSVNSWVYSGAYGLTSSLDPDSHFSGRVVDVEPERTGKSLRVAAASGGLWGYIIAFLPYAISDKIPCLNMGSFATSPTDPNTIIVGTGEPSTANGMGVFITTDEGNTWAECNMHNSSIPKATYKVRYSSWNNNQVFAATQNGLYRSDDNGKNFYIKQSGVTTDVLINPYIQGNLWSAVQNDGIYYSTNNGNTWHKSIYGVLPNSNIGRVSLGMVGKKNGSTTTHYILASIAKFDSGQMYGLYITNMLDEWWTNITDTAQVRWGQGYYNNCVAGNNNGVILHGFIHMDRSTDLGVTWHVSGDTHLHDDLHMIVWKDSSKVYAGCDGGLIYSYDAGLTWENWLLNVLPITQYYSIAVSGDRQPGNLFNGKIWGSSQDNGMNGTIDNGNNGFYWGLGKNHYGNFISNGTDGWNMCIDPNRSNMMWGNDGGSFVRSTNSGKDWIKINSINNLAYREIRNDKLNHVTLYTTKNDPNTGQSDGYIYQSGNDGDSWSPMNIFAPFSANIRNIDVSFKTGIGANVYVCFDPPEVPLKVSEGNLFLWPDRSADLPANIVIQRVLMHPSKDSVRVAYALVASLMNWTPSAIFKTTNTGVNWTNITGDLPFLYLTNLIANPSNSNILYLATQVTGCYKTTNGGINWMR